MRMASLNCFVISLWGQLRVQRAQQLQWQTFFPLGPKPRLVPYFTEAELLPEANEWWSTVNWPSSELMIPRWTALFIQSPLLPISSSTFTFNWIWRGGQSVSGFADFGWMQHTEKTLASISCSFWLFTWPKQSMTCWQTHLLEMENMRSPHHPIWQSAVTLDWVSWPWKQPVGKKGFLQKILSWLNCAVRLRQWGNPQ